MAQDNANETRQVSAYFTLFETALARGAQEIKAPDVVIPEQPDPFPDLGARVEATSESIRGLNAAELTTRAAARTVAESQETVDEIAEKIAELERQLERARSEARGAARVLSSARDSLESAQRAESRAWSVVDQNVTELQSKADGLNSDLEAKIAKRPELRAGVEAAEAKLAEERNTAIDLMIESRDDLYDTAELKKFRLELQLAQDELDRADDVRGRFERIYASDLAKAEKYLADDRFANPDVIIARKEAAIQTHLAALVEKVRTYTDRLNEKFGKVIADLQVSDNPESPLSEQGFVADLRRQLLTALNNVVAAKTLEGENEAQIVKLQESLTALQGEVSMREIEGVTVVFSAANGAVTVVEAEPVASAEPVVETLNPELLPNQVLADAVNNLFEGRPNSLSQLRETVAGVVTAELRLDLTDEAGQQKVRDAVQAFFAVYENEIIDHVNNNPGSREEGVSALVTALLPHIQGITASIKQPEEPTGSAPGSAPEPA